MAGCETKNLTGDHEAGRRKVLRWVYGGLALGGVLGFLNIADLLGLATLSGGAALAALGALILAAAAGAILGFAIGWAVEWFDRLKAQSPSETTISGLIVCTGKNTGLPPWNDNDWTFNMRADFSLLAPVEPGLDVDEIRFRAAPDSGLSEAARIIDPNNGLEVFHTEIGSHIGDYAAVGAAAGSVAGAIAGGIIGAAACVALGLLTFGLGLALCALLVAGLIVLGAAAGYFIGDFIGSGLGWIADQVDDFDERGKAISAGCVLTLTGAWVTDTNHQHNEIHDIERAQIVECGVSSSSDALTLTAAVGTGRHPTGPDP